MMKKSRIFWVALLLVLVLAPAASARLAGVGPLNPANGFPLYYVDTNGVALELPAPPLGTALTVPPPPITISPTMVFDPPIPGNAFSEQIGFGSECFYWVADADWTGVPSTVGKIVYRAGLEAAFGGGDALSGDQMVFSRIRLRVDLLAGMEGTYTVHHPYGEETIEVTTADIASGKGINLTRDIGLTVLNFSEALAGDVGPFLIQTAPIVHANEPPGYPTTGWIGDGNTPSPVTGSPIGFNAVSITPPPGVDLGFGPGAPTSTSNFVVSGHRYPNPIPTPLTLNRVTYTRNYYTNYFDIFATSSVGSTVNARIVTPTPIPMAGGLTDLTGLFFRRANYASHATRATRANPFNPSAVVRVTSQLGTNLPTTISRQPVDQVIITQATWSPTTQILTVAAKSTDSLKRPILTVANPAFGQLVGGVGSFACPIAPASITVSSPFGGVASKTVQIITP